MTIDDYFAALERGLLQNPLVQRVFRYDNAPHHPQIVTFPHHKHIGPSDRLAPSDQPSLGQILTEIAAWLEANSS